MIQKKTFENSDLGFESIGLKEKITEDWGLGKEDLELGEFRSMGSVENMQNAPKC